MELRTRERERRTTEYVIEEKQAFNATNVGRKHTMCLELMTIDLLSVHYKLIRSTDDLTYEDV